MPIAKLFYQNNAIIYYQSNSPILTGWREKNGARLWRIALSPTPGELPGISYNADQTNLQAYSAYDLPIVEALVRYFHAAAGFTVRTTWLKAIKVGNYRTWPGLTLANDTAYCPSVDEKIKGHIVQSRQGVRSTKPKIPRRPIPYTSPYNSPLPSTKSKELHMHTVHISKLYTDDTGRSTIQARIGNQCLMLAYHCDLNEILVAPFKTCKGKHRLEAYK